VQADDYVAKQLGQRMNTVELVGDILTPLVRYTAMSPEPFKDILALIAAQ
jgi:hypothetical protein